MIWKFIKEAWHLACVKNAERRDRSECKHVAKVFNARYAYNHQYVNTDGWLPHTGAGSETSTSSCMDGFRWMCPSCNKIHKGLSWSVFSGIQYPACCDHADGHRIDY